MSEHMPHDVDELRNELEEHDEWFRHGPGEAHQPSHGDFNPVVVMSFLGVTILIVFGVTFVIVPWFGRLVHAQRLEVFEANPSFVMEYMESHQRWVADLTGEPTWIDEPGRVIRVPIEMAMDEVVERYRGEGR